MPITLDVKDAEPAISIGKIYIEKLRKEEYPQLNAQRNVYLNFTGGLLYSIKQLEDHQAFLCITEKICRGLLKLFFSA